MAITNGYTTLAKVKALKNIASVSAADDAVIEDLITQASRLIDRKTGRTFYARTETHLYPVPAGRKLFIDDDDLLTITTLTNGEGTTIANTEYYLYPLNSTPKWGIVLEQGSSVNWQEDANGNDEAVISVAGTWGYSATAPADIEQACNEIVLAAYLRRRGEASGDGSIVTPAGALITPGGIPKTAWQIIETYVRP